MDDRGSSAYRPDALLTLVVVFLFGLLAFAVKSSLGPLPLALALVFILYPHRREPLALRLLAISIALVGFWTLRRLGPVLTPFVVAFVLAYLFDPLVDRLVSWRVPRTIACLVPLIAVFSLGAVAVALIIPPIVAQAADLVGQLPALVDKLLDRVGPFLARWTARYDVEELVRSHLPRLLEPVRAVLQRLQAGVVTLGRGISWVFSLLSFLILTPVMTFYLLRDFPRIRTWLAGAVPARWRDASGSTMAEIDDLLAKYLRGQALSSLLVGIETVVVLALLGIPYALALGVLTGLMNFVPIVGFWLAFVPAILVVLLGSEPLQGLLKLVPAYFAIQFLDSYVVAPRVVGKRVGLHPAVILLAVLAFPIYFGVVGVLIAVPAVAVLSVFLRRLDAAYRRTDFYAGRPGPP
jgi:predicted PurR-regulated permease PerM